MHNLILAIFIVFFSQVVIAEECPVSNLGAFLEHENPRVISFVISLEKKKHGLKLEGFRLCNGNLLFENWLYVGKVKSLKHGQHIYLFREGKNNRAVAWVEKSAKPLLIPTCQKGDDCSAEGQYVISYDVHTHKFISYSDGPIILFYPLRSWYKA